MAATRFTVILMIVLDMIGRNQAEFDCRKSPMDMESAHTCCNGTYMDVQKFKDQCFNGSLSQDLAEICDLECILIAGGAFSNETFNIPKLKELVKDLTRNNTAVATVFMAGFKICIPMVEKKLQELNIDESKSQMRCSPFAIVTTFCASTFLYTHCPKHEWTDSNVCTYAREFLRKCGYFKGMGRKSHKGSSKKKKYTSLKL